MLTSGSLSYTFHLDIGQIICAPLPIILSSFTAVRNSNNTVTVAWTTQLETMVSIFIIERCTDGTQWSQIGTKQPTNGGSVTTNYTFIDNSPFKNNNFYRLKSVDLDGKISFGPVALVKCPLCTTLPPPPPPPPSCASLGIAGVDYLCSSTPGTVSLTNLPAGTYVNWYADASSQVNLTQGGASTSVTKVGNGLVYIIANVSGCSQGTITIHKQVQLGTALHFTFNITSAPPPNQYKQLVANCDFIPGTTSSSYHWTLNLGAKGTTTYTGSGMSASLPPCSGGSLTVTVNTPCGTATDGVTVYNSNCGPNFAMAPNPARRSLTITTMETADGTNNLNLERLENRSLLPQNTTSNNLALERLSNRSLTSTSMGSITKIQLYNKSGVLVFEKEFSTGQKMVNISLPNLAPDMYIIHIYNKTEKEVKQLLILQ